MKMFRRAVLAALIGGAVWGSAGSVSADDGTVFSGCISQRTDTSVTLDTSGNERITIDTTWLKPDVKEILLAECVTVQTVKIEGKYFAEAVEQGDEPNEVRGITTETTSDRENKSSKEDDDKGNNSGGNND